MNQRNAAGSACCGCVMGPMLVVLAIGLMWWNEGNAVYTAEMLDEGAANVIGLNQVSELPRYERDGKLVHFTGRLEGEVLRDDSFGVEVKDAISLNRNVQMYQWKEIEHRETIQRGNRKETIVTYDYRPEWSSSAIDSHRFKEQGVAYPANPGFMQVEGQNFAPREVLVNSVEGKLSLSSGLKGQIGGSRGVSIDRKSDIPTAGEIGLSSDYNIKLSGNEITISSDDPQKKIAGGDDRRRLDHGRRRGRDDYYDDHYNDDGYDDDRYHDDYDDHRGGQRGRGNSRNSRNSRNNRNNRRNNRNNVANRNSRNTQRGGRGGPAIGDMRVSYSAVYARDVSIIAQLEGGQLLPYTATNGYQVEMLSNGKVNPRVMFERAHSANNVQTWILRGVAFVMTFFGLRMAVNFVDVLAGSIPLIGSLVGGLVGIAMNIMVFFSSLSLCLFVIGLGWLYYRPLLGIALLAGGAGLAYASSMFANKNKGHQAPPQPAANGGYPVGSGPSYNPPGDGEARYRGR